MALTLDVLSIFPAYLEPLRHALLGKAMEEGLLTARVHDLRNWATDRHQSVDDAPYGGGPGMVMKPTVWGPALADVASHRGPADIPPMTSAVRHLRRPRHDDLLGAQQTGPEPASALPTSPTAVPAATTPPSAEVDSDADKPLLLVPTPTGVPLTQTLAQQWAKEPRIVCACGRYEGIDQRVFDWAVQYYRVQEVSIGDYVLVGGEVAVLVIAEAVVRLIPGVLGNRRSHEEDSFSDGLLEGPTYTKPRVWEGLEVPAVLSSGNHQRIERWRRETSLRKTLAVRPELLSQVPLDAQDLQFLAQLDDEWEQAAGYVGRHRA